ncbi:MAG: hypothetical protein ACLT3W_03080 [Bifidobacterium pseudocatenulatum]
MGDWEGLFKALNAVYPIAVDPEAAKDAVSKLKGDKAIVALQELIVSDAKDQYADFEAKLGEEGLRQLERRVSCSRFLTASGANTCMRWIISRTASVCVVWVSAIRWSNTSAKAIRCTTP